MENAELIQKKMGLRKPHFQRHRNSLLCDMIDTVR